MVGVLAAVMLSGCADADRPSREAGGTAEVTAVAEATAAPTETATPESTNPRRLSRPRGWIDEPLFDEQFCLEIGGEWDPIIEECDHPSFDAPLPDGTDPFVEIQRILNDARSDLGVTEDEFVVRWNDYVELQGIAADASLDGLGGFDLGNLYYTRNEILTISLHVYLQEDEGDVATIGIGSFPDVFITWSTWRLAEAAMLAVSPELTAEEATSILTTLTAGYEVEIEGVNSTHVRDGVLYRLIDGGGDNGVWLTISAEPKEHVPSALGPREPTAARASEGVAAQP